VWGRGRSPRAATIVQCLGSYELVTATADGSTRRHTALHMPQYGRLLGLFASVPTVCARQREPQACRDSEAHQQRNAQEDHFLVFQLSCVTGRPALCSDGSRVRGLDVRMAAAYALKDAGGSLPHRCRTAAWPGLALLSCRMTTCQAH